MDRRVTLSAAVFLAVTVIGWQTLGLGLMVLIPAAAILSVLALLGDSAARSDSVSATGYAGSTASIIQAFALVLAVWAIWEYVEDPITVAKANWWLAVLIVVGLFAYWYLQHRRQVASASTAINRTQRTAKRSISSWTELIVGIGVLVLTGGFAVASGMMDALAPYAGELGYLFTVFIGYVQLGGDAGGTVASIIPSLEPMQWVGVTLFIAAMAYYIRYQS
ncbi:hypothetical protein RH831_08865 [Halodesulfurarchaeum sp. HSR-GB]|uniref:hypothetical protein n=1 Tax=Halodesulfurarchaeum sp. HSR-GB TaxID=3074077 RepID=UPI00286221EC|nr:hypothetical protein [Halodesulfurarchaeum sp. HSR-GB]MDR5657290.1 hypothetical protein [Halodesulfurarchaeum sp. HSR-GB]